eukprot:COSAG01_NODE_14081_length_1498_cov_1.721944_1_plen_45_part_10
MLTGMEPPRISSVGMLGATGGCGVAMGTTQSSYPAAAAPPRAARG